MTLGAVAMLVLLRQLTPTSTYAGHVLPGLFIIGVGDALHLRPVVRDRDARRDRNEAGVASAMVNTCQQVGGAVGTAVLSTIFANAASSYASSHQAGPGLVAAAAVHGYTTAFYVAAALFAVGFLVAALVLPRRIKPERQPAAAPAPEPA